MASENERVEATLRLSETFMPGARSVRAEILGLESMPLPRGAVGARVIGDLGDQRRAWGSGLEVTGELVRSEPGKDAGWVLFLEGQPRQWSDPSGFLLGTDGLRRDFLERSLTRTGEGAALLPGLAIGDTSAISPSLIEAMQTTSLSHLVAVSGANCAVVVAIVVAIVALLGGGVWLRMIVGVMALLGFVALVTPEPSIMRAALMASIVLAFMAFSTPAKGIPVLGSTVLLLLAWNPWLATDFAFALSVSATAGILIAVAPLTVLLSKFVHPAIALVIALPIAAQVACQPLLILLNPVIPVWGVLANALAAPLAPFATILGMLACVTGPLWSPLANFLTMLAWVPSSIIAALGRVLSETPLATIPWPVGPWGAIALGLIGYGGLAWLLIDRDQHRGRARLLLAISLSAALGVLVLFAVPSLALQASVPEQWSIAQCDVGQGDSILLRSEGFHVLIDTGEFPDKLETCLSLLGVTHLDLLVLTHFDKDHVTGWPALIGKVTEVWTGPPEDQADQRILDGLASGGALVRQVSKGESLTLGGYSLDVVWPDKAPLGAPGNDSSVVVALTPAMDCQGCLSGLFLGDLGERAQQILSARENFGTVDVVKVSHHGSADQFHPLYETLRARVAMIGVGGDNTYGHPTASILSTLAPHSTVVRSDLHGTATLHRGDSGGIVMWAER
jgi:competence protein ComEC